MNKFQFSSLSALLGACVVVALLQFNSQARLEADNLRLRQQIARPTSAETGSSNPVPQTQESPWSSASQLMELERLRTEADTQKREIQKLEDDLAAVTLPPLPTNMPSSSVFVNIPKEAWRFAGYATPEDALQSMLWATREGDVNALRASLTPEEQQRRKWTGKTDQEIADAGVQGLTNATGFQILKLEWLAEDRAHFSVYIDGFDQPDQPLWMDMKKIGNEWKSDASEHHRP